MHRYAFQRSLLITGASRGIGAATARLAAAGGWDVAINYRQGEAAAQAVAADVRAQGRRAVLLRADVADDAQVGTLFAGLTALGLNLLLLPRIGLAGAAWAAVAAQIVAAFAINALLDRRSFGLQIDAIFFRKT